jgi:hypothetical protein
MKIIGTLIEHFSNVSFEPGDNGRAMDSMLRLLWPRFETRAQALHEKLRDNNQSNEKSGERSDETLR